MEHSSTLPEEQILITNDSTFTNKINTIKQNQKQTVIVSDFDYTFSQAYISPTSKTKMYSSYCFIENSTIINTLNPKFREELANIANTYSGYERDTSLEFNKRKELVRTWFQLAFELYAKQGFHKDDIYKMVTEVMNVPNNVNFAFRDGIKEMFETSLSFKIPVVIISGGIKEVIVILLQILLGDNLYTQLIQNKLLIILANSFSYDSSTLIVNGYDNPFIYTFNKSEYVANAIKNELSLDSENINIIVIGDHLNDYDSITQCNCPNVIGIGFVNYNKHPNTKEYNDLITQYQSVYDVNLINNSSFKYITSLLRKLKNN